jgi:hypothetical protein
MDTYILYEVIGYAASILIALSLMMRAIVKLRVINMIGAATFCVYGMLIGAYPVAVMNGFIVLINIYYLYGMLGSSEDFSLIRVPYDSEYLQSFLQFHEKDIEHFQPGFNLKPEEKDLCIFILRDMVPAGLVIGNLGDMGRFNIRLDFAIPSYRDLKVSQYLFKERKDFLSSYGIRGLLAHATEPGHRAYLEKIGFEATDQSTGRFELAV